MKKIITLTAVLGMALSITAQPKKNIPPPKPKPVESKVYLHELLNSDYSVLSQDEITNVKKSICTQFASELQQYLGLGASQNYKIRIAYINAGGIMKGYSFFNELYEGNKSAGANILFGANPGSPDAFIKLKVEGENITQVEVTNIKTGEKTTAKMNEPTYSMKSVVYKQTQLLVNKNILSGTEKATQTGFADRPSLDPMEDILRKKHSVILISDFLDFQTPGGSKGMIYKHPTEKGNYTKYTHYVTDMKGNPLINGFVAPTMPKYGEVFDLTYTTISDGKSHNLKVPYGGSFCGMVIQQLIAEGYLK
ncbi:MAG: hypothetical protein NTW29_07975 [Bacteroidetes bacterium]|nr:hypothetical protein [Bacteroidota bacterium]